MRPAGQVSATGEELWPSSILHIGRMPRNRVTLHIPILRITRLAPRQLLSHERHTQTAIPALEMQELDALTDHMASRVTTTGLTAPQGYTTNGHSDHLQIRPGLRRLQSKSYSMIMLACWSPQAWNVEFSPISYCGMVRPAAVAVSISEALKLDTASTNVWPREGQRFNWCVNLQMQVSFFTCRILNACCPKPFCGASSQTYLAWRCAEML